MCRRVTCDRCGKPTYAGCGQHVEQVLGDVAKGERCQCRETEAPKAEAPVKASWLGRMFGGRK